MNIIDLSHPLTEGMPVYPESGPPEFSQIAAISTDGYAEKRLCLFSHTGTHVDAPSHVLPDGPSLDAIPITHFAGTACVLDFSAHSCSEITYQDIAVRRPLIGDSEFVLIHTGWSRFWGSDAYYAGYPVLSMPAAEWLSGLHLKGVGVDAISVDHPGYSGLPVHCRLLSASILIIENLNCLGQLPPNGFIIAAFPLRIQDGDGSPLRAVAVL